jgi:3-methylcrotonyl-CoA carboxylase alpha subunit
VHWHGPTLLSVVHGGQTWRFEDLSEAQAAPAQKAGGDGMLTAPMPGLVTACPLDVGQAVEAGAVLLILEAMKMEHTLRAPFPARVAQLNCAVGDQVTEGTTLVMLEPLDEKDAP